MRRPRLDYSRKPKSVTNQGGGCTSHESAGFAKRRVERERRWRIAGRTKEEDGPGGESPVLGGTE